jgi:sigma-E factor negative regulatory protein RseC
MIEETAWVVEREGDYVWVEAERKSTCGQCAARKGCGTGALANVLGRRPMRMKARNTVDARTGDQVIIGLQESALIKGSIAVYLLPLVAMMVAAMLGQGLAPQFGFAGTDKAGIVSGMVGLGLGFLWVWRFGRSIGNDERYQATTLRRVPGYVPGVAPVRFQRND